MTALCSRVDCGEPAAAVFGFDAGAALVWLDPFDGRAKGAGMLCATHADTLTPLRGWTLQDRRVRAPRLWADRPRITTPSRPTTRRRRTASVPAHGRRPFHPPEPTDPLPFDSQQAPSSGTEPAPRSGTQPVAETVDVTAEFDDASEFERLLDARSPLLTRAFQAARTREG
jgi:hypothetical protein